VIPKKVHLIGIGGVGMSGLAILLKRRGWVVSGCDIAPTKRTEYLKSLGIEVFYGHDESHVEYVDEVVVTPAVPKSLSEVLKAKKIRTRGEVLAEIVSAHHDSIAVSGTHGKTTTATYIAKMLIALGESVEWAIGGESDDFPVAGGEGVLVVEADESDRTLAKYHAKTLVVTNVEFDHPDTFKSVADYESCFDEARAKAQRVIEGTGLLNEEIAALVAIQRGHDRQKVLGILEQVSKSLPDRRFQRVSPGIYTDYAHHPTEIKYCLKNARRKCRGKIFVIFQPHRYSRTKSLLEEFATSFDDADFVFLTPVYPAFEKEIQGGRSEDLYLRMDKGKTRFVDSKEQAWEEARQLKGEDDIIILLGAGDIIDICNF
jgi:UDP-N-acetylmuramate--alanine ligase